MCIQTTNGEISHTSVMNKKPRNLAKIKKSKKSKNIVFRLRHFFGVPSVPKTTLNFFVVELYFYCEILDKKMVILFESRQTRDIRNKAKKQLKNKWIINQQVP